MFSVLLIICHIRCTVIITSVFLCVCICVIIYNLLLSNSNLMRLLTGGVCVCMLNVVQVCVYVDFAVNNFCVLCPVYYCHVCGVCLVDVVTL